MKFNGFQFIFNIIFWLIFVFYFFFLVSCDDTLKFKNPEPSHKKDLRKFPGSLQGWYKVVEDSSIISVTSEYIFLFEQKYEGKHSLNQIDYSKTDTMIDLRIDHLKRYRGTLYLSSFGDDQLYWEVVKVVQTRDSLNFYLIWLDEVKAEVKDILPIDTVINEKGKIDYYISDPTRKQWKKLHKGDFFKYPYAITVKIKD